MICMQVPFRMFCYIFAAVLLRHLDFQKGCISLLRKLQVNYNCINERIITKKVRHDEKN